MPKGKPQDSFEDGEERLSIVALLDIEKSTSLQPLTYNSHRLFLPLPLSSKLLLDVSLEWIIYQNDPLFQELYLICHEETRILLFEYFENSPWKSFLYSPEKTKAQFSIKIVVSGATTLGDALREIDHLGMFHFSKKPILLLRSGMDIIAQLSLKNLIQSFSSLKEKSRNMVMLSLFQKKTLPVLTDVVLALDNQRLIAMESINRLDSKPCDLFLPMDPISQHSSVDLVYNLIPCGVDLITVDVLALFTENFDYQSMDDFVLGILNSDILSYEFYIQEKQPQESLTVVNSLQSYRKACFDLLQRRFYPSFFPSPCHFHCRQSQGGFLIYKHKLNDSLDPTLLTFGSVYVGHQVTFGPHCELENVVLIGPKITLGSHIKLKNTIVFDNVIIEDHVTVTNSILGSQVTLGSGCTLDKAILGLGSILPKNFKSLNFLRTLLLPKIKKDSLIIPVQPSFSMYHGQTPEDELCTSMSLVLKEDSGLVESIKAIEKDAFILPSLLSWTPKVAFALKQVNLLHINSDSDSASEMDVDRILEEDLLLSGFPHMISESLHLPKSAEFVSSSSQRDHFMTEAKEAMEQALLHVEDVGEKAQFVENTSLEMNALKFACNMSLSDVREAILPVLISQAITEGQSIHYESSPYQSPPPVYLQRIGVASRRLFTDWSFLIHKFTPQDEQSLLLCQIFQFAKQSSIHLGVGQHILRYCTMTLCEEEVIEPEIVIQWFEEESAEENEALKASLEPFIAWLQSE